MDDSQDSQRATPVPVAQPQPRSSSTTKIVLIVLAVVLLMSCVVVSILAAIAIPVFTSAREEAGERACFANQRTIEGAALTMQADSGALPESISQLVDEGYLMELPVCVMGGRYVYSAVDGTVTCDQHGHYE